MKEKIFEAIKLQSGKINFKNLSRKFDIDTYELNRILLELKLDGKILQIANKYMIFPDNLYLGKVITSTSGRKYILYNERKVQIASNFFNDVILHDVVTFKFNNSGMAEIVTIVDRPLGKMTCEVVNIGNKKKIIPYHYGIHFTLDKETMDGLYDGDIILVETSLNDIGDYAKVNFIKKIGRKDDPEIDDIIIAVNYGFDNEYTSEYIDEVKKIPTSVSENEINGRVDYRNQKSFTIDGVYTKDMDDAVFGEMLDNNIIRIYVHIADVSHYIKQGSKIFERACDKTTSLYMNNTVFPMLHYIVSNGICSLNPHEDRLSKTVIMDIDENGNICNYNIVKSVIKSKMKMNYDDCDKVINGMDYPSEYNSFIDEIAVLHLAASRLERRYIDKGKLNFANLEPKITYNNDNTICEIKEPEYSPSAKIIENLMVCANETVASWLYNMEVPAVYRILEQPSKSKINEVIDILNRYGYNIRRVSNVDSSKSIQIVLDKIRNYDTYPLISQMLIMSMQRARYSTTNLGHYALSSDAYLHFTSPIRRLPDLLVHMICDLILVDYNKICECNFDDIKNGLEKLAARSSKMERQADMAEVDGQRRLIIKKMEHLVGEEIEGTISEIGNMLRIKLMGIDTYVKMTDISDNFIFDAKRKLYYDSECGRYMSLGTKVNVRIIDANSANRTINVRILSIMDKQNEKSIDMNVKTKLLKKKK